ncbi:unnamed protein product, partial [Clonostachys rhizophaga]
MFQEMAEYTSTLKISPVQLGIAYDGWAPNSNKAEAQRVADLAKQYNVSVVMTHAVGGQFGSDNSPEQLQEFDLLDSSIPVVFSHATYLSDKSAELLRSSNQYIPITPESEAFYGLGHSHSFDHLDQTALGVDIHPAIFR